MASFSPDTHWRDSARTARLWILDAQACFPILLVMIYPAWWTFLLAVIAVFFFTMLARRGFTVTIFFRWLRSTLAGKRKVAHPWWL